MKIGFILEPYEESEASGMGYSVMETAKALAAHAHTYELTIYASKPVDPHLVPGSYRTVIVPKSLVGKFFYFLWMKKEVDVLFFVVALLPLWVPKKIKTVVICKELPDHKIKTKGIVPNLKIFIRDRLLMPLCMSRALKVLSSSEATTRDVMEFYHVPKNRIEVISEGYQDWARFSSEAPALDEKWKPYFLFTGKVKARKNVHGIVDAFIALKERTHSDTKLLIVGSYGGEYHAAMLEKLRAHHLEGDVHFLGYVSAPMMYSLYTNAVALVFPSFSEGFGMPLVEAMSLGLPVIASNVSSFVEVVGDAGILINPHDPATISNAMEDILKNPSRREEIVKKGFERAKQFSWEKVGEKYRDVLAALPRV